MYLNKIKNSFEDWLEYQLIEKYYQNKTAQRSGVALINHIHEGLIILQKINASTCAQKAYCLHPLLQSDEALLENYLSDWNAIDSAVLIAVLEYRSTANAYLSKRIISSLDDIVLSPLKDVNDMLIADKIQNKKDFELYHKDSHPRTEELSLYFDNWLAKLAVSTVFYQECKTMLCTLEQ